MPIYFIAGTDTEVGKTAFTVAWAQHLRAQGHAVLALKPVASGSTWRDGGWRNDDALQLQQVASTPLAYGDVNPITMEMPWSPHLAAEKEGRLITLGDLDAWFDGLSIDPDTTVLIEGAGGWYCPINRDETLADWVVKRAFPVLLVVGMRLGCLNHAMLTAKAMVQDGVTCLGWVANTMGKMMPAYEGNRETLEQKLPMSLLAELAVDQSLRWIAHAFYTS